MWVILCTLGGGSPYPCPGPKMLDRLVKVLVKLVFWLAVGIQCCSPVPALRPAERGPSRRVPRTPHPPAHGSHPPEPTLSFIFILTAPGTGARRWGWVGDVQPEGPAVPVSASAGSTVQLVGEAAQQWKPEEQMMLGGTFHVEICY